MGGKGEERWVSLVVLSSKLDQTRPGQTSKLGNVSGMNVEVPGVKVIKSPPAVSVTQGFQQQV